MLSSTRKNRATMLWMITSTASYMIKPLRAIASRWREAPRGLKRGGGFPLPQIPNPGSQFFYEPRTSNLESRISAFPTNTCFLCLYLKSLSNYSHLLRLHHIAGLQLIEIYTGGYPLTLGIGAVPLSRIQIRAIILSCRQVSPVESVCMLGSNF